MVKAIRVHVCGGPEQMVLEEVALPPPGKGEVRVRHAAMGLNFIDVYFRTGLYPAPAMPFTPGNEGAGTVVSVGEGVVGFKPGDRVAYAAQIGSYAEERNVSAHFVVKLPKDIGFESAAGMMLKGMTAEYLLFRTHRVKKGDVVLMHAAAGGVGLILCQWARSLGATVIGTVGSADKAKLARKHGCHHTILYREENFVERVREITGGKLCDVVYDGVGKDTFLGSLDCLKPLGMFVSFGNASGPIAAFDIGLLAKKGSLVATRPTLFTFLADRKRLVSMARRLFTAVRKGDVTIPVTGRFPLAKAAEAHRALEGRGTTGSIIFTP
ncbi:MAG TPA: quinone oxidoreductase [Beijerinckiaceae bacterium]|nr:quinone oxidoreductase [Beijerinckiaceae bacterium]